MCGPRISHTDIICESIRNANSGHGPQLNLTNQNLWDQPRKLCFNKLFLKNMKGSQNYWPKNTKYLYAACSHDSYPIFWSLLTFLSLLPCLSPRLLRLPNRFNSWLYWFTSQTTAACYPSSWSCPADNVVSVITTPSTALVHGQKGLVSPWDVHCPHERASLCTLKSQVIFPHPVPEKEVPSIILPTYGTWGMGEPPRTLNSAHLTFKAFLEIDKSTEEGLTKLVVLFTMTESTPTVLLLCPRDRKCSSQPLKWTDCRHSEGSSLPFTSFQPLCLKSKQREQCSCK